MSFDYTNYLEVDATVEADFIITNRAGTVDTGLSPDNTAGEWCLGDQNTTSSGTGPTSNPSGRSGFIYTESSTSAASTTWAFQRDDSFDSTTQDVKLDLIYNLNATATEFYVEYATVASPNQTTDWTVLETIAVNSTDAWVADTFDFSAISTTTLWIRIRYNSSNTYTNDLAFSTWREYSVDSTEISGITKDATGSVLGSCDVYLFLNNATDDAPSFIEYQLSNATTGAYTFSTGASSKYFVIAKKDGTPNVFDTTDHVLVPEV